jgi:hypothetical protein
MAVIRNAVKKLADYLPVVRSVAVRREKWARQAEDADHPQTATVHWYAARTRQDDNRSQRPARAS